LHPNVGVGIEQVKSEMCTEHYSLTPRADEPNLSQKEPEDGTRTTQAESAELEGLEKATVAKEHAETDVDAANEKLLADFSAAMTSSKHQQGKLSAATLKQIPTACRQVGEARHRDLDSVRSESVDNRIDELGCLKLSWQRSLRAFTLQPGAPSLTLPVAPTLRTAQRSRGRSRSADRSERPHASGHQVHDSPLRCTVPQGPHLRTPSRSRRPLGVSSSVTEFDRPRTTREWKPALTVPVAPQLLTELRSQVPRSRGSSADTLRGRSRSQDNTPQTSVRRAHSARCTPRAGSTQNHLRTSSRQARDAPLHSAAVGLETRSERCCLDFGSDPVASTSGTATSKSMKECAESARQTAQEAFDADCQGTKHLLVFGKDVPQSLSEATTGLLQ